MPSQIVIKHARCGRCHQETRWARENNNQNWKCARCGYELGPASELLATKSFEPLLAVEKQ